MQIITALETEIVHGVLGRFYPRPKAAVAKVYTCCNEFYKENTQYNNYRNKAKRPSEGIYSYITEFHKKIPTEKFECIY